MYHGVYKGPAFDEMCQLIKGAVCPLALLCPVLKAKTPEEKGGRGNTERRKFLYRMFLWCGTCGVFMYFLLK